MRQLPMHQLTFRSTRSSPCRRCNRLQMISSCMTLMREPEMRRGQLQRHQI